MKRILLLTVLALIPLSSFSQGSAAEILESRESFQMKSLANGTYTVYNKTLFKTEKGASLARVVIFTDDDKSLASFSATVTDPSGKVIRKIKKQDLESQALAQELADDSFVYFYKFVAQVPFIVEYEYSLNYKRGVPAFPTYIPVTTEDVKMAKGEYSLEVPSGTKVQFSGTVEPEITKKDFKDQYVWHFSGYEGFESEKNMPRILDVVPYVFASPVDFMFSKVEGKQGSWKDIGLWLYDLQKDTWDLSDQDKAKIQSMTSSCSNSFEKVKVLYDYLRQSTRYVSIQLGIGGYKPFQASKVSRTGFGDCKALSNYLKAMLEVAGVKSDYFILNTSRSEFDKGYASVGQMNHAMLAVPMTDDGVLKGDTLWVECTNPTLPLGYRHDDVAGHQVVLIKEDGGEMVKCSRYPDSLSRHENTVRVLVNTVGDAFIDVKEKDFLDFSESMVTFSSMDSKDQSDLLASRIAVTSNSPKVKKIWNNFNDYPLYGKSYVPEVQVDYSFECRSYAESNGGRLFIPVTPLRSGISFQRGERKNDIFIESGYTYLDTVVIMIPQSYELESLPKPVNLNCSWADLSSEINVEGNKVVVVLKAVFKAGKYPKDSYAEYRTAARKFNNLSSAKIVFRKKQN